jgi:glycine/D-amino acid oxidase-like deaminating enzyme
MRAGQLGHWWRSLGGEPPARPALAAPAEVDVAIVGAGFTGLWTAYYLKRARPELSIAILEREFAGFGASGRNGGWVSGLFSGPPRAYERAAQRGSYGALQRAMLATVDEVLAVAREHGIDADLVKDGQLSVALNRAQAQRLTEHVAAARAHGLGEQDLREISPAELNESVLVEGALAATFTPHCARAHPAKLVTGLAAVVEGLGVAIYERTAVHEIRPHQALTPAGAVRARWVVRATEGYTPGLRGLARALAPVNSSMIVTEPLDDAAWAQIGWRGAQLLGDGANVYVYLQRTADGRIAIGGRGVPYRFASRSDRASQVAPSTVAALRERLAAMFPAAAGTRIEDAWAGVLGVPRDWCPSVVAQPASGLAWAGGYVGEGVAASNLAARTLRDLILGERSELTRLAWVGRRPRSWEPEPLRWAEIRSAYALYRHADRAERRAQRPSRLARLVDAISGRE